MKDLNEIIEEQPQERWCVEHKAGLDALNKYIEQNGLFADEDAINVL